MVKPASWSPGIRLTDPLATDLKVAIPFWKGSGTPTGLTANTHEATLNGAADWGSDASGDYIHLTGAAGCNMTIANHADFATNISDLTMMVLVRPTEGQPAYEFVASLGQGAGGIGWAIETVDESGGVWRGDIRADGSYAGAYGTVSDRPTHGTWALMGAHRDGNTNTLVIDGVKQADTEVDGTVITSSTDLYIGDHSGGNKRFTGDIALFLFWSRALSQDELTRMAADPWTLFRSMGPRGQNFRRQRVA